MAKPTELADVGKKTCGDQISCLSYSVGVVAGDEREDSIANPGPDRRQLGLLGSIPKLFGKSCSTDTEHRNGRLWRLC